MQALDIFHGILLVPVALVRFSLAFRNVCFSFYLDLICEASNWNMIPVNKSKK